MDAGVDAGSPDAGADAAGSDSGKDGGVVKPDGSKPEAGHPDAATKKPPPGSDAATKPDSGGELTPGGGGCGCSVVGTPVNQRTIGVAMGALGLILARRRRRRVA
jgi:MYXO-CTERM domain-containing protein